MTGLAVPGPYEESALTLPRADKPPAQDALHFLRLHGGEAACLSLRRAAALHANRGDEALVDQNLHRLEVLQRYERSSARDYRLSFEQRRALWIARAALAGNETDAVVLWRAEHGIFREHFSRPPYTRRVGAHRIRLDLTTAYRDDSDARETAHRVFRLLAESVLPEAADRWDQLADCVVHVPEPGVWQAARRNDPAARTELQRVMVVSAFAQARISGLPEDLVRDYEMYFEHLDPDRELAWRLGQRALHEEVLRTCGGKGGDPAHYRQFLISAEPVLPPPDETGISPLSYEQRRTQVASEAVREGIALLTVDFDAEVLEATKREFRETYRRDRRPRSRTTKLKSGRKDPATVTPDSEAVERAAASASTEDDALAGLSSEEFWSPQRIAPVYTRVAVRLAGRQRPSGDAVAGFFDKGASRFAAAAVEAARYVVLQPDPSAPLEEQLEDAMSQIWPSTWGPRPGESRTASHKRRVGHLPAAVAALALLVEEAAAGEDVEPQESARARLLALRCWLLVLLGLPKAHRRLCGGTDIKVRGAITRATTLAQHAVGQAVRLSRLLPPELTMSLQPRFRADELEQIWVKLLGLDAALWATAVVSRCLVQPALRTDLGLPAFCPAASGSSVAQAELLGPRSDMPAAVLPGGELPQDELTALASALAGRLRRQAAPPLPHGDSCTCARRAARLQAAYETAADGSRSTPGLITLLHDVALPLLTGTEEDTDE